MNRKEKLQYYKEYYQKNHDDIREKQNLRAEQVRQEWRSGVTVDEDVSKKAEEVIAPRILTQLGVKNLHYIGGRLLVDYLAEIDGEKCAIEVTTYYKRRHRRKTLEFFKFLNMRLYVLFISPDFTRYIFKENSNYARDVAISFKKDFVGRIKFDQIP